MMRKDIDLSFTPHPLTGDLSIKKSNSAILQSVRNLVLTNYYERGFNIEVGSNIIDSLFENITPLLQQTIKNNVVKLLGNFEPGIEIDEVDMYQVGSNTIEITISFFYYNDPEVRKITIPLERL